MADQQPDPVDLLLRWEEFGGTWRVITADAATMTISLCRCDGGEEIERLSSPDPALRAFVGTRQASTD
jgi:hypothetical protein